MPPPARSSLELRLIVAGGVIVVVAMVVVVGCICCKYYRHTRITAEQKVLYKRAHKLEREATKLGKNLSQDPGKRKVTEGIISRKMEEASKLCDRAASLPQERYKYYLDKADEKESEEINMINNLSSDPKKAELEKRVMKDKRKAKKCLHEKACCCMPDSDADNGKNEGGGSGEKDTSATDKKLEKK